MSDKLLPPTDREPVKVARVLHYLYEGGNLNRFEAASLLHDTCLNSTISTLRNDYGIRIKGRSETVPGYNNLATICTRYCLEGFEENTMRVCNVLTRRFGYSRKRNPLLNK